MSPIHDQSYRRYGGNRAPLGSAWMVIARTGIRTLLARKWFLGVLLAAFAPFIVHVVWFYSVTIFPAASQWAPINTKTFVNFMDWQGFFAFFVSVFVGSGLIASDRRANALQIYLSKPLIRTEYVAGKLAILVFFLTGITAVPALLLVVFQIAFAANFNFISANAIIVPGIVLASAVRVLVPAVTILALSSLSTSTRYVAIMFAGVFVFTEAIYTFLSLITGSTRVAWVSVGANIQNVTDFVFRQPPRYDAPVLVSVLVLAGLLVVSFSVLERRVRGVEVVS